MVSGVNADWYGEVLITSTSTMAGLSSHEKCCLADTGRCLQIPSSHHRKTKTTRRSKTCSQAISYIHRSPHIFRRSCSCQNALFSFPNTYMGTARTQMAISILPNTTNMYLIPVVKIQSKAL